MPIPKNYRTKEAAVYLGISRDALETLAARGIIPRFKLGGRWHYAEIDLDTYYKQQHQTAIAAAARLRDGKKPLKYKSRPIDIAEALKVWD